MKQLKFKISYFFSNYGKITASVIVILSLIVACVVSLVEKNKLNNQPVGVIMSMSNLVSGHNVFGGNIFDGKILNYEDMLQTSYEAEQLAQLEYTEAQLEAFLASIENDVSSSATLGEYTGDNSEIITHPGTPATVVFADGSSYTPTSNKPQVGPSVAPTYGSSEGAEDMGEFLLTGYCPCPICCGAYSNIETPTTASGAIAAAGRTVAADTSILPFGTKIVINGQVYVVEDRGGAIKNNHIDIFFSTHEEALQWGKRYATVYRLPE